jgi:hypothetical protein
VIQYGNHTTFNGIWVSNVPLGPDQGVKGGAVLRITSNLTEAELADYEWKEERLGHREWSIPAHVLNTRGQIALDDRSEDNDESADEAHRVAKQTTSCKSPVDSELP